MRNNFTYFIFIFIAISCSELKEDKEYQEKESIITNQKIDKMKLLQNQLMTWSSYELVGEPEAYIELINALAKKAEESKVKGISRYSFYLNEESKSAGAIIIYDSPQAFIDWHELAPVFEEYEAFKKTVKSNGVKLYGNLAPNAKKWLEERNVSYEYVGKLAGGFMR